MVDKQINDWHLKLVYVVFGFRKLTFKKKKSPPNRLMGWDTIKLLSSGCFATLLKFVQSKISAAPLPR